MTQNVLNMPAPSSLRVIRVGQGTRRPLRRSRPLLVHPDCRCDCAIGKQQHINLPHGFLRISVNRSALPPGRTQARWTQLRPGDENSMQTIDLCIITHAIYFESHQPVPLVVPAPNAAAACSLALGTPLRQGWQGTFSSHA